MNLSNLALFQLFTFPSSFIFIKSYLQEQIKHNTSNLQPLKTQPNPNPSLPSWMAMSNRSCSCCLVGYSGRSSWLKLHLWGPKSECVGTTICWLKLQYIGYQYIDCILCNAIMQSNYAGAKAKVLITLLHDTYGGQVTSMAGEEVTYHVWADGKWLALP